MANPQNLRPPWQPGESGNPKGRPKRMTNVLREFLEMKDGDGRERIAKLIETGYKMASAGDFAFWQAIFDRMDGKVAVAEDSDGKSFVDLLREATERRKNHVRDERPDDQ